MKLARLKIPAPLGSFSRAENVPFEEKTLFLGLGPAKTGTTWLHSYLREHPEFLSSRIKELHFFSALHHARNPGRFVRRAEEKADELARDPGLREKPARRQILRDFAERRRMIDEPSRYIAYFRDRARPGHKAFGELSPSYCALTREGYRMMRAQHPRIRVMICLRDPIARTDAVLRQIWHHGEPIPYDRFFDSDLPGRLEHHNLLYEKLLDTIFDVFDEDEVRVQFFEEMFNQASLDEITGFIGIASRPGDFGRKLAHMPPADEMTDAHRGRLAELLAPTYAAIRARFGERVPDSWAL